MVSFAVANYEQLEMSHRAQRLQWTHRARVMITQHTIETCRMLSARKLHHNNIVTQQSNGKL